jgi:hypothetical protein
LRDEGFTWAFLVNRRSAGLITALDRLPHDMGVLTAEWPTSWENGGSYDLFDMKAPPWPACR